MMEGNGGFDDSSTFKFVGIVIATSVGGAVLYDAGFIRQEVANSITTLAFGLVAACCIVAFVYVTLYLLYESAKERLNNA